MEVCLFLYFYEYVTLVRYQYATLSYYLCLHHFTRWAKVLGYDQALPALPAP